MFIASISEPNHKGAKNPLKFIIFLSSNSNCIP